MKSPDPRLYLMARIVPKAEYFNEAKAALEELIPPTLEEEGADCFRLHEGQENGTSILFLYETFTNQEALDFHFTQGYTQKVFEQYQAWLAEPIQSWKMRHIAG